jgi:hypothetical protein
VHATILLFSVILHHLMLPVWKVLVVPASASAEAVEVAEAAVVVMELPAAVLPLIVQPEPALWIL